MFLMAETSDAKFYDCCTVESLQAFELDIAELFNSGQIRAPVHLAGGNERGLIDVFKNVSHFDWVCTNWRSHYHCLLKGVPRNRLKDDILAGRSITLNYPDYRIVSSAIVGGVLPIAVGLAASIKRNKETNRVWAFLGDMTAMGGMFFECLQYSIGHDLPIKFVIEDNGKSVATSTKEVWGQTLGTRCRLNSGYVTLVPHELPWPHSGAGVRVNF